MFAMVDSDNPLSLAKRYADHPRCDKICFIFAVTSIYIPHFCNYFTLEINGMIQYNYSKLQFNKTVYYNKKAIANATATLKILAEYFPI